MSNNQRNDFVNHALTFLSWGVEYVLPESPFGITYENTTSEVYNTLDKNGASPLWLSNDNGGVRSNNYLPDANISHLGNDNIDAMANNSIHILQNQEGFDGTKPYSVLFEAKDDSTELILENIEAWTAINNMWSESVSSIKINNVVLGNSATLYDSSFDTDSLRLNFVDKKKLTIDISFENTVDVNDLVFYGNLFSLLSKKNTGTISISARDNVNEPTLVEKLANIRASSLTDWQKIVGNEDILTDGNSYFYRSFTPVRGKEIRIVIESSFDLDSIDVSEIYLFDSDALKYNHSENFAKFFSKSSIPYYNSLIFQNGQMVVDQLDYSETVEGRIVFSTIDDNLYYSNSDVTLERMNSQDEENHKFLLPINFQKCQIDANGKVKTLVIRHNNAIFEDVIMVQSNERLINRFIDDLDLTTVMESNNLDFTSAFQQPGTGNALRGNPIPFTVLGVDSPRSFLNKMKVQEVDGQILPAELDYDKYLVGNKPGFMRNSLLGYDLSSYHPNKSAGTDSIGLLLNCLSMLVKDGTENNLILIETIRNQEPVNIIDQYNRNFNLPDAWNKDLELSQDPRLTAGDLEYFTTVISNRDNIQKGDILVKYDANGELQQIGIIVEEPIDNQFVLITASRDRRMVYLAEWNTEISNYSLSQDWESFVVRRILQKKNDVQLPVANWDLLQNLPKGLEMKIAWGALSNDIPNAKVEHWVSNTGSYIPLNDIKFKVINLRGNDWSPVVWEKNNSSNDFLIVNPLDLKDPYHELDNGQSGNIYKNSSRGEIILSVQDSESKEMHDILKYVYSPDSFSYQPVYIEEGYLRMYKSDMMEDYPFYLTWYSGEDALNPVIYKDFYIKSAADSGNKYAQPGDDFLLDFELSDYPGCRVNPQDDDLNFLAVYDHKMLWRANLYIDEGGVDWNDSHPWVTGNEWNRTLGTNHYDGFVTNKLISSLDPGDGKQVIDIPDYSLIWAGGEDEGKVAYDFSIGNAKAFDSPFDFIYKLLSQRENIENFYTAYATLKPDEPNVTFNNTDSVSVNTLKSWGQTIAPVDQWRNYRTEPSGGFSPYLPGLGLYQEYPNYASLFAWLSGQFEIFNTNNPNALSAGVDCIGFVQRSASYSDSTYKWTKLAGNITEGASSDVRSGNSFPASENAINVIANESTKETIQIDGEDVRVITNLDKIVPGDIVYYNGHIMMIQRIEFNGMNRRVDMENIYFIESTSGNYGNQKGGLIYFVTNTRNINQLSLLEKSWIIGRLK